MVRDARAGNRIRRLRCTLIAVSAGVLLAGCPETKERESLPLPNVDCTSGARGSGGDADGRLVVVGCADGPVQAGQPVRFRIAVAHRGVIVPTLDSCGTNMRYGDEAATAPPEPVCQPLCTADSRDALPRSGIARYETSHVYDSPGNYAFRLELKTGATCGAADISAALQVPVSVAPN